MKSASKKAVAVLVFMLLLVSLLCPSYQSGLTQESERSFLACQRMLYLERLCFMPEGYGVFEGGASRYILQAARRQNPRILPFNVQCDVKMESYVVQATEHLYIGLVFIMIMMVIVSYIFRADGKKRVYCK